MYALVSTPLNELIRHKLSAFVAMDPENQFRRKVGMIVIDLS